MDLRSIDLDAKRGFGASLGRLDAEDKHFANNDSDDNTVDEITWDTGYNFGARVGAKKGRFRIEGELGYRAADGDIELEDGFIFVGNDSGDLELSVLQGSINGFYDITDIPVGGLVATPMSVAGSDLRMSRSRMMSRVRMMTMRRAS